MRILFTTELFHLGSFSGHFFSYGRSNYTVMTDKELDHQAALIHCHYHGAELVNISTADEFYAIQNTLSAMDITGRPEFWIGDHFKLDKYGSYGKTNIDKSEWVASKWLNKSH